MTSSTNIQNVQEVLNNLTNSISSAELTAAIAQTGPPSVDPSHFEQQAQKDQEQLQRIAQQHQQQIQQEQEQEQQAQAQAQAQAQVSQTTTQVLQHIGAADSASTLATVPITNQLTASQVQPTTKPVAGSEEWHRLRRDNHKEVERRRRETINDGINELAKVVPNCEKNKGSILRQAVKYIQGIQETNAKLLGEVETINNAKFELEKLAMEKSVSEAALQNLTLQHEQLKREYEQLAKDAEEAEAEHTVKKQRVE